MEEAKRKQVLENRKILERQMLEEKQRREAQQSELRQITNLTYGPQETEEISQLLRDRQKIEQEHMKSVLMDQIKGRAEQKKQEKQRERELEAANVENITKVIEQQQRQEKLKRE